MTKNIQVGERAVFRRILFNEGGDSFIVLMTALSVILLAFFILLNSIAVIDDQRVLKAWGSLVGAFHILPGGYVAAKGSGTNLSFPSPPITDDTNFFKTIINKFEQKIYEDGFGEAVSILRRGKGLTITLSDQLIFSPGSGTINTEGRAMLKKIARIIKMVSGKVEIEGHMDSIPISTEHYPSKWEFSVARAVNILEYFVYEEKIDPKRFSLIGYADSKPIFSEEENRDKNGRIEISLISIG